MRLRSLALSLTAAVLPLGVAIAPAEAAPPTNEEVQRCNQDLGTSLTADQLVEKASSSATVTTRDGYSATITGVSFEIPGGGRCELITASSADARAGKVGFRFVGTTQAEAVLEVDGQAPTTQNAGSGQFLQPLLWFMPDPLVLHATWAGETTMSGVIGDGDWSPDGPTGAHWTMSYRPAVYAIDVHVFKATPHDRPASDAAIAAAATTRDTAIGKARTTCARAVKRAKATERAALAKAETKRQRAKAIAAYQRAVRQASVARGRAIAAARAAYAQSTVVHDVDYALTSEVLHVDGTIPR